MNLVRALVLSLSVTVPVVFLACGGGASRVTTEDGGATLTQPDASDASADATLGSDAAASPGGDSGSVGVGPDADDGSSGDTGGDAGPVLTMLSVTPSNAVVQLDLGTPGSQTFVVRGTYADGTSADLTSAATFTIAHSAVGAMTGATLAIAAQNAVAATTSRITATVGTLSGAAQLTVFAHHETGPLEDVAFVLPYQDAGTDAGTAPQTASLSTAITSLDVFSLVDTTGDMVGGLENLAASFASIPDQAETVVPNAAYGVGAFEDFPVAGDANGTGNDGTLDQPFKLRQLITTDAGAAQTAINGLLVTQGTSKVPIGQGGDAPESATEALYQVATGSGLTGPSPTDVPANDAGIGGVGFRSGALPVVIVTTNAEFHDGTDPSAAYTGAVAAVAHTLGQAEKALASICARVVGVAPLPADVTTPTAIADETAVATASGARVSPDAWDIGTRPVGCAEHQCCTGSGGVGVAPDADGLCPLVFQASPTGIGVSASGATGLLLLTKAATFNVNDAVRGQSTDVSGNALPAPHTTADFLQSVVPSGFTLPSLAGYTPSPPTFDTTGFKNVTPATTVRYTLAAFNGFVPATSDAQLFAATLQAFANDCTPLGQEVVLVLVPPAPLAP